MPTQGAKLREAFAAASSLNSKIFSQFNLKRKRLRLLELEVCSVLHWKLLHTNCCDVSCKHNQTTLIVERLEGLSVRKKLHRRISSSTTSRSSNLRKSSKLCDSIR